METDDMPDEVFRLAVTVVGFAILVVIIVVGIIGYGTMAMDLIERFVQWLRRKL